ncbi:MAG: hypothetical protein UU22_C0002G0011 [Parcubacteria group bacterium GW2011_GWA2_40_8]|nr:MAG: hypothetical protein UT82_C0001G0021 [Parcubacteria group bacterium GW2011_GWB1_40_14]KKR79184.1 MAG: hypothetical protein UU22_C0002G0011 [Parcubacteria group bacterium GW2011_GWA2_40_8]
MLSDLQKAILSTIVYYDVLDMAPTFQEIYSNLLNWSNDAKPSLGEILTNLDYLKKEGIIDQNLGFNFLPGRDNLSSERIDRLNFLDQKWKKAKWGFKLLATIPYVRIVFASGSFALGNTDKDSDIDVLIVLKKGRIWTGRFLVTLLLHILRLRRHGKKIKDRICLNHFITDESMKIPFESLYNAHVYANLVPVLALHGAKPEDFFRANEWIKKYINFDTNAENFISSRTIKSNRLLIAKGSVREIILNTYLGDLIEKILKQVQEKRILNNPLSHEPKGHVVANDNMLAFHPDSPEDKIMQKYRLKLAELGISQVN